MKYATATLLFAASIASAAQPAIVSRTTAYGPFTTVVPTENTHRVVVRRAGETTFLIWNEQTTTGIRIRVGPLTSAGIVDPARVIELPRTFSNAALPDAASSGDEILVVWYEERLPSQAQPVIDAPFIYFGARIGSDGALLDPSPIVMGASPKAVPPHVAWNGSDFVVSWPARATMVTHSGVSSEDFPLLPPEIPLMPWTADTVDISGSDGHAFMIAQGLSEQGNCRYPAGRCYPSRGPETVSFLFDANGKWGPAGLNLPFPTSTIPLTIGPAPDGFVVAWNDVLSVRAMHVTTANGELAASDVSTIAEYPSPTGVTWMHAANDLVVWNMIDGNPAIESTVGRLSPENENASLPDVLWLGGDRYLVAYLATNGPSVIQLVTIDVTGRRRAVR